jgi:hypothetical protein
LSIVDNLPHAHEGDDRDDRDPASGQPRHLLRDAGGVAAGQRDVRRSMSVDLYDLAGDLDPRAAVVGHGHLEDAAGTHGQEVRVLRVVVDDAPLRAE